jgi:hypothetical protein
MTPFHFTSTEVGGIVIPAKIESKAELLALLARAIPLPDYFGQNWDALEECLGDLEWLDRRKMVLIHHDIPLQNAPAEQRTYLEILAHAAKKSERLEIIFPESCRAHVQRILSPA